MRIFDLVGKSVPPVIRNDKSFGKLEDMWHKPQAIREKSRQAVAADGTRLTYTGLSYVAGMVTMTGLRMQPVLTGYMSGCFLFRFRRRGELYVAHVGTHDTREDYSGHAKEVWRAYVNRPHISNVRGFDPANDVSQQLLDKAKQAGSSAQIIGAWEPDGKCYAGVVATNRDNTFEQIVVGFERVRTRPWREISLLPKFR